MRARIKPITEQRDCAAILLAAALLLAAMMVSPASGADFGTYKPAEEPVVAGSRLELSANVALTTDYVFRGFSQTDESPAIQGGFDATYGAFYLGIWASNLDFGGATNLAGATVDVADIEVDIYGGVTKEMTLGGRDVTFDLGVIYYAYPNAFDSIGLVGGVVTPLGELDFWEFKFGWSYTILQDVAVSSTLFFSPDYTGEIGDNWVYESTIEKPIMHGFSISGTLGNQWGDESDGGTDYTYWNVGVSKQFREKFTADVRYWDTDIGSACDTATIFQCDARVVGTLSASF